MNHDAHNRRKDDGWHIGRTVDLGHILTTIILVIGGMTFVTDLDKRIAVLENSASLQEEIRQDIKEIKQTVAPLPDFIQRKNDTDKDQWDRIRELERDN